MNTNEKVAEMQKTVDRAVVSSVPQFSCLKAPVTFNKNDRGSIDMKFCQMIVSEDGYWGAKSL